MKIILENKTILLRKIKLSDADSIFEHANNPLIAKHTHVPFPYTKKDAIVFIRKTQRLLMCLSQNRKDMNSQKKCSVQLGITLKNAQKNARVIGMIALMNIDFKNKHAEIGYWLSQKYWGQNIMTNAIFLILAYGFEELGLERIYAKIMHPNIASAKLLEKVGFTFEGRLRKTLLRDSEWIDDLSYSLLSQEFFHLKQKNTQYFNKYE
jgi:RimJ/RimL family protein N-acetyltransferase